MVLQVAKKVVDELLTRRKETEWFIEGDFDAYVERIRQCYVWGGEPELLMASHVFKVYTAMKLFYEKLRSPSSSMAAAKRGAVAMKLFYEKLRSAFPLPCFSPMGGIEELLKKRMEQNQKKTEAGSSDKKNEGVKKPTATMNPVEMMSTFLVLQGIVDSMVKDTSTVHSVRKETVENAASVVWKIATGADVREQKANVSSILKELHFGNANVGAIDAKFNAVDVKFETLMVILTYEAWTRQNGSRGGVGYGDTGTRRRH
ncbi:unnamed protein product [Camellia sinensis]